MEREKRHGGRGRGGQGAGGLQDKRVAPPRPAPFAQLSQHAPPHVPEPLHQPTWPPQSLSHGPGRSVAPAAVPVAASSTATATAASEQPTQAKSRLARQMLQATKNRLWDRIAALNNHDRRQTISLREEPLPKLGS